MLLQTDDRVRYLNNNAPYQRQCHVLPSSSCTDPHSISNHCCTVALNSSQKLYLHFISTGSSCYRDEMTIADGLICMEFNMQQWLGTMELWMSAEWGKMRELGQKQTSGEGGCKNYIFLCHLWMTPNTVSDCLFIREVCNTLFLGHLYQGDIICHWCQIDKRMLNHSHYHQFYSLCSSTAKHLN